MDLKLVVICNIFNKSNYKLNIVTNYIEQNYPGYKYYSKYNRKTPLNNTIFRFYKIDNKIKNTISVLPSYILTRKQKSLKIFYKLLNIYSIKDISIEKLWSFFDTENHFKSITTLRRYFKYLHLQINSIMQTLITNIIILHQTFYKIISL